MNQSEIRDLLDVYANAMAGCVLSGKIAQARINAREYAYLRDELLTWPELKASLAEQRARPEILSTR